MVSTNGAINDAAAYATIDDRNYARLASSRVVADRNECRQLDTSWWAHRGSVDGIHIARTLGSILVAKIPLSWRRLWSGTGGVGEVLRIALPMAASTGCTSLALFTDRTMLYEHNPAEMAAAMAAGNLFWTLVCFPIGVVGMSSAFVAQYVGADRRGDVGRLMFQTIWLSLFAGAALMLVHPLAEWMFQATGQAPQLVPFESIYLRILLWSSGGVILESALSGFYSGVHRPGIVLWVNLAATIINIALDFVLIFGWWGFPELGIFGAGLATTISIWFKAITYLLLLFVGNRNAEFQLRQGMYVDWKLCWRFLWYSIPAGLQYLLESASFLVIVLQIGQVSEGALAATTIAINFNMLAFIPLIGVSIAASVLVGNYLTAHGKALAMRATRSAILVSCSYAGSCALIYLFLPELILDLYAQDSDKSLDDSTLIVAQGLLRFVAAYCVFDAIQIVLAGTLRGAGDTWFVLAMSFGCAVLGIGCGWYWEPEVAASQLNWWWWVITLWVISMAVFNTARVIQGSWANKRLVEPTMPPLD